MNEVSQNIDRQVRQCSVTHRKTNIDDSMNPWFHDTLIHSFTCAKFYKLSTNLVNIEAKSTSVKTIPFVE